MHVLEERSRRLRDGKEVAASPGESSLHAEGRTFDETAQGAYRGKNPVSGAFHMMRRMFRSDFLGDPLPYRRKWGSRFDFIYYLSRDHRRFSERLWEKAVYWAGLADFYSFAAAARGATILMYHSIPTPDICPWVDPRYAIPQHLFESQVRFLKQKRRVIPFRQLIEMLERNEPISPRTVVLTFDDGYLDTLRVAAPLLKEYGLPATVFPVTGYVGRGQNQWGDEVFSLFVSNTREKLDLPEILRGPVNMRDPKAKAAAYDTVNNWFKHAFTEERQKALAALEEQLQPQETAPRLTMTWEEVRELIRDYPGFSIGLHGAEHMDLTAHDVSIAKKELDECLRTTRKELGLSPDIFAFPYNRISQHVCGLARQLGFRAGVASGEGTLITAESDRMALPRVEVCRSMSLFRFRTTGAYPALTLNRIRQS